MVSRDIEVIIDDLPFCEVKAIHDVGRRLRDDPHEDDRVQEIRESWPREAFRLDISQRDRIGHLFLQRILKLDRDTLLALNNDDAEALVEVSEKLEGFARLDNLEDQNSGEEFWGAVQESVPGFLDPARVNLLKKVDRRGTLAWEMISVFDEVNSTSPLLYKLTMLL